MDTHVESGDRPYTLEQYSHDHFRFTVLTVLLLFEISSLKFIFLI